MIFKFILRKFVFIAVDYHNDNFFYFLEKEVFEKQSRPNKSSRQVIQWAIDSDEGHDRRVSELQNLSRSDSKENSVWLD